MSELINANVPSVIVKYLTGKIEATGLLDPYVTFDPRILFKAIKMLHFSTNFLPGESWQIFDYEKPDLLS